MRLPRFLQHERLQSLATGILRPSSILPEPWATRPIQKEAVGHSVNGDWNFASNWIVLVHVVIGSQLIVWKGSKVMKPRRYILLMLWFALSAVIVGCSSDSSTDSSGNGDGVGTGREFVSGNLANGQSFSHVFPAAKVVPYYCRHHGGPGGVGMSGTITVQSGGTPTSRAFSISDNTLPSMTINVQDTVTWTNNDSKVHTVESDN